MITDGFTVAVFLPFTVAAADCPALRLLPLRFVVSLPAAALPRLPVLFDPFKLELDDLVDGMFSEPGFTRLRFAAGA